MSLKCGIVGLPNVGKSTLFNALVSAQVASSNYPFCTIEPNIGVINIPDPKLPLIADIIGSAKHTPATTKMVDIAGLVKGASLGEGLGNQFLGHIREVDAIIHLVRCFINDDIVHVDGSVNPERDIEVINTELLLSDLQMVENKLEKDKKAAKVGDKEARISVELLEKLYSHLNQGYPARTLSLDPKESSSMNRLLLLTQKPILYVSNTNGIEKEKSSIETIIKKAEKEGANHLSIDCELEAEIMALAPEERAEYLTELGLEEPGLHRLVHSAFELLGLLTFYSANVNEVRSWTIKQGTKAPQAAGVIHTDFERGFIRAECFQAKDLLRLKSETKVKEAGLCRLEGKDYTVQQDDVLLFKFNV